MKKSELKSKIKNSFSSATPNILERIKASCENSEDEDFFDSAVTVEPVTRKIFGNYIKYAAIAASLLVMFLSGLLLGRFIYMSSPDEDLTIPGDNTATLPPDSSNGDNNSDTDNNNGGNTDNIIDDVASVYIDVNPSIQLDVDINNKVVSCKSGNDDASVVIGEMNLVGIDIKTALNAIIGSMYMNGYLVSGESNSMLLSVHAENEAFDNLLTSVVTEVNSIIENSTLECSIVAQKVESDNSTSDKAKEHSISYGKMSLINKIILNSDDYTEEDIEEMSKLDIKTLNQMYAIISKENKGDKPSGDGNLDTPGGENPDGSGHPENPENPGESGNHGTPGGENSGEGNHGNQGCGNSGEENRNPGNESGNGYDDIMSGIFHEKEKVISLVKAHIKETENIEIDDEKIENFIVIPERENTSNKFEIKIVYHVCFTYEEAIYLFVVDVEKNTVAQENHSEHIPHT